MKTMAVAGMLLLGACAPLQQAPLVYSSKTVLGIDVSATTTETPGASFAFGYKQVDAAYVPVAVAKLCEKTQTGANCLNDIYKLTPIAGNAGITNQSASDEAKRAAENLLTNFTRAQEALNTANLAVSNAEAAVNQLKQELKVEVDARTDIEKKAESDRSDSEKVALANHPKRLDDLNKAIAEKEKILAGARQVADQRKAAVNEFNTKDIAEAQKVFTIADSKNDAFSVFGSFDANTKTSVSAGAGKPETPGEAKVEPTIALGKVFSTGVASQNLTLGMQRYYAGLAASRAAQSVNECVTTAAKVADALKGKDDIIKTAFEACKSIENLQRPQLSSDDLLRVKQIQLKQ